MTGREITLELRMPDNKFKKFTQDFVPFGMRQKYIGIERDLEKKYEEKNEVVPEEEYMNIQVQFVADLFEDKTVTKELILNGLDALDKNVIYEIIRYRVLGYTEEDDQKLKKALTETEMTNLLGEDSTNSK